MYAIEIIKKFGGHKRFSELTGMNESTARWYSYQSRLFPAGRMEGILAAADLAGVDLSAEDLITSEEQNGEDWREAGNYE